MPGYKMLPLPDLDQVYTALLFVYAVLSSLGKGIVTMHIHSLG